MKALKALILGSAILCGGTCKPVQGPGIEESVPAATDVAAPSPSGDARDEAISPLAGRWRAAETTEQEKRRLQAIDEGTEGLGRLQRGVARSRLAERTTPAPSLMIEFLGSMVTIASADRTFELELGGAPIEISEDEGTFRVTARLEGDRLIVVV
jgi:hypothetical protein